MARSNAGQRKARFGTFSGVFTPTVLTILGIILFLRLGWVVGQAGLVGSILIIGIASLISLLTGLSLSAIATNMHVKTGGAYYMISRTLGIEMGGAIGIPLYLSQAVSVSFYIIGFSEAFTSVFPTVDPRILSTGLALAFGILAYVGADIALKIQFVVLAVLGAAILSFFSGGWGHWVKPPLFATTASDASFWQVFAIFFPAVTGITVGLSMSGDLKDPVKSIPRGTLIAIGITTAIYLGTAIWLSICASTEQLLNDNLVMQRIALWPNLIILGVWVSTLSSALGSVVAAPRTLQAISYDRVVPKVFGSQMGSATEPRFAVLVTSAIAVAVIWSGDLDFVAPVITMFFLNTYGMINLTAGIERLVGNPSFRPRFRVPWIFSLLGAVGCYGAMLLINVPATFIAVIVSYGIFALLTHRSLRQNWEDIGRGLWFEAARLCLVRLESHPIHARNWRPNIVVFTAVTRGLDQLMQLGSWFSAGRGIVTFCTLISGDVQEMEGRRIRETARGHLRKYLEEHGIAAFAESPIVRNSDQAILTTLQTHGIAGLEPNTALFSLETDQAKRESQFTLLRRIGALQKSVLFLKCNGNDSPRRKALIDVWWRGRDRNAELMLMLAYLIRQSKDWENARIRLMQLVDNHEAQAGARNHLSQILASVRVEAQPVVLVKSSPDEPFASVLRHQSRDTDLVFLGIPRLNKENTERYLGTLDSILQSTGWTVLVRSAESEDILEGGAAAVP